MNVLEVLAAGAAAVLLAPPTLAPSLEVPDRLAGDGPSFLSADDLLDVMTLSPPLSGMLRITAGTFSMGSTGEDGLAAFLDCQKEPRAAECDPMAFANEGPVREITLSSYFLDRTEVTVADYARCVGVGRCRGLPFSEGGRRFDRPFYPVSFTTWNDARAYCAFRGARLPTEAEYERAARGPNRRRYPWGDLYASHVVNHGRFGWDPTDASDGFAELARVGSFPAGATKEGLLDLAGNVAEWTSDRYAPTYSETDLVDPQGPGIAGSAPERVVRGGSFESAAPFLRGAARQAVDPDARRPTIGFRCARSARAPRDGQ